MRPCRFKRLYHLKGDLLSSGGGAFNSGGDSWQYVNRIILQIFEIYQNFSDYGFNWWRINSPRPCWLCRPLSKLHSRDPYVL